MREATESLKSEIDAKDLLLKEKNDIIRQIIEESKLLRDRQVRLLKLIDKADQARIDEYEKQSHETRLRHIVEDSVQIEKQFLDQNSYESNYLENQISVLSAEKNQLTELIESINEQHKIAIDKQKSEIDMLDEKYHFQKKINENLGIDMDEYKKEVQTKQDEIKTLKDQNCKLEEVLQNRSELHAKEMSDSKQATQEEIINLTKQLE